MRRTELLLGSLLILVLGSAPTGAWAAQAAVEAGMASSVSGLTSTSSHKLGVSKTYSRIDRVSTTATPRRTTARQQKANTAHKKAAPGTASATAASHSPRQQGHVVSVWPKDALTQTQAPPQ